MTNFALLQEVGSTRHPVILKRGLSATIEELLMAAEYILAQGNDKVILCERGIRTFEKATRFTLDINAVPVIKKVCHLPVIIDPSHATGTWEYVTLRLARRRRLRRRWVADRGAPPPGKGALGRPAAIAAGSLCCSDGPGARRCGGHRPGSVSMAIDLRSGARLHCRPGADGRLARHGAARRPCLRLGHRQ